MTVDTVKRDDWLLAGAAFLLVIDLLALPWFEIGIGPISITSTGTGAPDGWLGLLAVLATVALIADLGIERLAPQAQVPAIAGSRSMTRLTLAGSAALFVALKFLFHIHFGLFGFGFWAAIVLSGGLIALARRAHGDGSVSLSQRPASPPSA